ncbi:MAG: asparagine synthase B [Deltaproteobacteria bacterium]|nr:MAG: asparagine synthase B [Deltaproteobacteria bacterium]
MCGIVSIFHLQSSPAEMRKQALDLAKRIRHRGPDWSGIYADDYAVLAHERLAIVDIDNGAQPLRNVEETLILAVNGEIYNHMALRKEFAKVYDFQTNSDCEVILPLYQQEGTDGLSRLNGIYSFVLYDKEKKAFLIARDPIGVIPLYWGWDAQGNHYIASEMKALIDVCAHIEEFPPGQYYWSPDKEKRTFYNPAWVDEDRIPENPLTTEDLKDALEAAVKRQMMSDVPYGVLLSGGLDSSIISAVAMKYSQKRVETDDKTPAWWPQLHSFSIGLEGAPDLAVARRVADDIGTIHHEFNFTVQEGLDALRDVIYHLETYDVTTIRASTPMYLLARRVRAMGIKMLLSGEGADEIFGGYLYFHKAPNAEEFHKETVRKIKALHQFDCLRANKSTAAWGIETRVPFLDLEFLKVAMDMDPSLKMIRDGRMEKQILRDAFASMLPVEVTQRQKEQFSDGVGYSWIDSLRDHAEKEVTDKMMENAAFTFPYNTPSTKEAYYYRSLFEQHYPGEAAAKCVPGGPSIACSTPAAIAWDASFANMADPSGRAVLGVHNDGYNEDKPPV